MNVQKFKDNLKVFRRFVRTFIKSPGLAMQYSYFRKLTSMLDWASAEEMISEISRKAVQCKDSRLVKEMSEAALRLGSPTAYMNLQLECAKLDGNLRETDWKGDDLSDATLWISFRETEKQGLATGLNMVGYVKYVADQAKHTVLVVEPRLVSVFSRTLPKVEVIKGPREPCAIGDSRLVTANPLILMSVIGVEEKKLRTNYYSLKADSELAKQFACRYRVNEKSGIPLIGIEWGTQSPRKKEAPLDYWVDLVSEIDAVFIVLQYEYDGFDADVEVLRSTAKNELIVDKSVNQLVDMDRFAAQLTSLDLLISTHSSDSHFAGALGVPMILVCDDMFRRSCQVYSYNRVYWYPDAVLLGKNGRAWSEVFDEVKAEVHQYLR